jgi:hypothetical protein
MATARSFWIFPLKGESEPYQKEIPNPDKYVASDELVIPIEIMERYKAKASDKKPHFTFNRLRINHQYGIRYLEIKDMKECGKGAFAGQMGVQCGSMVVYSGMYAFKDSYTNKPRSEQAYLGQPSEGIALDARNMVSKTRYMQHLPGAGTVKLDESIAEENYQPSQFHFSITLNGTEYYIPTVSYVAKRAIAPGEILGFDYKASYWKSINMTPSFFKRDGSVFKPEEKEAAKLKM